MSYGARGGVAILVGGDAGDVLEQAGEVLRVLEAEFVGDLAYALVAGYEAVFGKGYEAVLDVLFGCFAGFFFDEVAEVVGRQAQFCCTPLDSGEPPG